MKDLHSSRSRQFSPVAMIATAIGAVAVGAFAIGALAVGRSAASWSGTPNSNHLRFRTSP